MSRDPRHEDEDAADELRQCVLVLEEAVKGVVDQCDDSAGYRRIAA